MRRIFLIPLLLLSAFAQGQTFDAPGTDPQWNKLQPNAYSNLKHNNGIYPASAPNRTEYYPTWTDLTGTDRSVTAVWNLPNDGLTVSGRFYTPTQYLMGIPRCHAKGYTGVGVKIMVIDGSLGYSNSDTCLGIGTIAGTIRRYGWLPDITYLHTAQVLSVMACKPVGSCKLVGGAYGAQYYSATSSDLAYEIRQATTLGVRIIVIPHFIGSIASFASVDLIGAIKAFQKNGVILAATGNGGSLSVMQELCGLKDIVSVGSLVGGTVLSFQDVFYSRKVQPVNGKGIDFALPAFTIAVNYGKNDDGSTITGTGQGIYKLVSNTSFDAPEMATAFAICMQKYPRLSPRVIYHLIKQHSRPITVDGVTVYIPNLSFIK